MTLYLTVMIFSGQWQYVGECPFGKLNAGVLTGKVTMAAASFQLGWPKRNVFIEGEWGEKTD